MADLVALFRRLIAPLEARVRGMVSRGVVTAVDDTKGIQELQLRLGAKEVRSIVERFGTYGFTSHPPKGSEAVAVFVGGSREHPIAAGVEDRSSRKSGLAEGDASVYCSPTTFLLLQAALEKATLQGDDVSLAGFDSIVLAVGTSKITLTSSAITIEATTLNLKGTTINLDSL